MKHIFIAGLALFLLLIPAVQAAPINVTEICENDICVEGREASWNVTIVNWGREKLEYSTVELVDVDEDHVFGAMFAIFNPQSNVRGTIIAIEPTQTVTVVINDTIPPANTKNDILIYEVCTTNTVTAVFNIAKYDEYEERFCYHLNASMKVIQCLADFDCEAQEFCSKNQCKKRECAECQFIANHTCHDYECCSSSHCAFNELCRENVCEEIECGADQYIENRTCKTITCAFNQHIVNKTCQNLACSYEEYAFNHSCQPLECGVHEIIQNNTCKQCGQQEFASNTTCLPLRCLSTEAYENHECVPLECAFYEDIINHTCVLNQSVIIKLALEVIAVLVIGIFLFVDIRKWWKKNHENKTIVKTAELGSEESK